MNVFTQGSFIIKKSAQWIHAKCFHEVEEHVVGGKNKCCRCLETIEVADQSVGQYGAVRGWFHAACLELYEDKAKDIQSKDNEGGSRSLKGDYA